MAAWTAKEARSDLVVGKSALVDLASLDPLEADLVALQADLAAAHVPVASGRSKLSSPLLWPLRPLPILGRQLSAARGIANTADAVLTETETVVAAALVVQDAPPERRVEGLQSLSDAFRSLDRTITDRDLGPSDNLMDVLVDAHFDAEEALAEIEGDVHQASLIVNGLTAFVSDSNYLMLGANVNEMQIGGATPLNFGELRFSNGDFTVSEIQTIIEAEFNTPTPLQDPDVGDLWGFINPTNDFKKLMLTHRFAEFGGPQALVMYDEAKGKQPDGVLFVDSLALQGILEVVGPVVVEGREFRADNVLDYILVEQYIDQAIDGSASPEGETKYDRLAAIAAAVFAKTAEGQFEPIDMARVLRPIAAGRHILAYSTDPGEQAMWQATGLAGELDGSEIGVSLQNLGVNKLDPYLRVVVNVTSEVTADGTTTLDIDATFTNNTPAGLPDVVNGVDWEFLGLPTPTTYLGRIGFLLPGTTTDVALDPTSEAGLEVFGADGKNVMVVTRAMIVEGETRQITATVTLSGEVGPLHMMPSGRYPTVTFYWNGVALDDFGPHELPLGG
ncbi:MAG: DUF4012 domain-containing protein [Acidimicrobiales bacterium]